MTSRRQAPPSLRLTSLLVACALLAAPAGAPAAREAAVKLPAHATPSAGRGAARRQGRAAYRAGQLLVRFRDEVTESERAALAAGEGASRRPLRGGSGVELWSLLPGGEVESSAANLSARAGVEYAEPNYLISADQLTPSDPRFPEQWALRNEGQAWPGRSSSGPTSPATTPPTRRGTARPWPG
jgi:hypothetical protein